jgi:hypothetical protein
MKTVEIAYGYARGDVPPRERTVDAESARDRMDDGRRAFAELIATLLGQNRGKR